MLKRIVNREWSVVTKITTLVCGIVTILVVIGGFFLIKLELNMVHTFTEKHLEKIKQTVDNRRHGEGENLRDYIEFIAQILNHAGAEFVFKQDVNAINALFTPYMKHPAILAIRILDQNDTSFDAMWKQAGFTFFGDTLSEQIEIEHTLFVQLDVEYYNRKVGSLQIYYSDASVVEKIEAIREAVLIEANVFTQASEEHLRNVIFSQSLGICGILLILMLCLLIVLSVFIRKPLFKLANIAQRFGDFDLTVGIETNRTDELGKLLRASNEMARSFRKLLGQVQQSGIQVTSSATELSATAKEQEAIITAQVESTHGVLESTEEISDILAGLVQIMQQVAFRFHETAEYASRGQTDLAHMENAMQHMENASISISNRLQTIHERAENITSVVTTITKVAEQTNLLSLNAAIEAEKAGESGRGFTVVAREIRRLADQTAVATLDIEEMVREMQSAVSAGVMEMDKFIAEVRHSAEDVERISVQLARIIEQVQALSPSFEKVNTAMEQQAQRAQKMTGDMVHLSGGMQETRDSLHETYSAIGQLNEAAKNLRDEVSRFKVN